MLLPVVRLKTPRNSRHPWIFKKMTQPLRGLDLPAGSLVEVQDKAGKFVARAFFHPENTIALRILTERPDEAVDAAFVFSRLSRAKALRERVLPAATLAGSFRLVHAEADGLPGLVIDKFADVFLIEPYVAGWLHVMPWVVDGLARLFPDGRAAVRADKRAAEKEGVSFALLEKKYPAPPSVDIVENGIKYRVDFVTGHKTGFFLDQRDNRLLACRLGKGARVLDLCSYTGGFALSAWYGGAASVRAVDLDEAAIAAAKINLGLNKAEGRVELVHADIFDELRRLSAAGERFDMVILDPPKLAASPDDAGRALDTYRDMNAAALRVVERGGFFLTYSCSGAVPGERWRQAVRQAAADAGLGLTIFHSGGAGADHPVSSDFPQGRYLKALCARVE